MRLAQLLSGGVVESSAEGYADEDYAENENQNSNGMGGHNSKHHGSAALYRGDAQPEFQRLQEDFHVLESAVDVGSYCESAAGDAGRKS
jgi:hypothetical protein